MRTRRSLLLLTVVLGLFSSATALLLTDSFDPHRIHKRIRASSAMVAGDTASADTAVRNVSTAADVTNLPERYDPLIPGDDPDIPFIKAVRAGEVVQPNAGPPYDRFALRTVSLQGQR